MSPALSDPLAFLESTPLVPIVLTPGGVVTWVGPQARDLLGLPLEDWYAADFWEARVVPDDLATLTEARRNSVEGRARHEIDYRLQRADGRILWVSELFRLVEGTPPTLQGFLWNVSDRKRQELALWRNEERVRGILRQAPDAMVLTDGSGGVINMNLQAEALFGYPLSDIAGSSLEHLLPECLRPRLAALLAQFDGAASRRTLVEGESLAVQRRDGSEIPVEVSLGLVSSPGSDRRILWSIRDLSVRRRMEARKKDDKGPR